MGSERGKSRKDYRGSRGSNKDTVEIPGTDIEVSPAYFWPCVLIVVLLIIFSGMFMYRKKKRSVSPAPAPEHDIENPPPRREAPRKQRRRKNSKHLNFPKKLMQKARERSRASRAQDRSGHSVSVGE